MTIKKVNLRWAPVVVAVFLGCAISCSRHAEVRDQIDSQLKLDSQIDPQLSRSILEVLKETSSLHPGMTRADLLRFYQPEPGIFTREFQAFAYKKCLYIKVNVTFRPSVSGHLSTKGEEEDTILSIQGPFLGFARMVD